MSTESDSPIITRGEAAKRLGVPAPALREMIRSQRILTVDVPGKARPAVLRSSVESLYAELYEATDRGPVDSGRGLATGQAVAQAG